MAGGRVPITTGHVKKGSVGDNSVQDAIFGTSGTLYTQLSTLASGCNNDMIDTTNGGTRGVTPVKLSDFKGYPKPELTMNYSNEDTSAAPCAFGQELYATPTLKYAVGFNIKIIVAVNEKAYLPPAIPSGAGTDSTKTFNFAAGNTTTTEGKTKLNTLTVSASQDILISCEPTPENFISGGWVTGSLYYIDAIPYSDNLEWTAAVSFGTLTQVKVSLSSINCSTDTSAFKLANGETGLAYYLPAGTFGNGDKMYFDTSCGLGNPAPDRWYSITDNVDGTPDEYWEVYNGDGSVRNYTTCP